MTLCTPSLTITAFIIDPCEPTDLNIYWCGLGDKNHIACPVPMYDFLPMAELYCLSALYAICISKLYLPLKNKDDIISSINALITNGDLWHMDLINWNE